MGTSPFLTRIDDQEYLICDQAVSIDFQSWVAPATGLWYAMKRSLVRDPLNGQSALTPCDSACRTSISRMDVFPGPLSFPALCLRQH